MNWFEDQPLTDVQTAIQSQAIQTVLEQNTSKISDAGFQSFLTGAPIPRAAARVPTGVYAGAAATTTVVWTANTYIDPFSMFNTTTGIALIPVDGWYSLHAAFSAAGTANSAVRMYWAIGAAVFGEQTTLDILGAGQYRASTSVVAPISAGTSVSTAIINHGAAALTVNDGNMGLAWMAPLYQYKTSAGGS